MQACSFRGTALSTSGIKLNAARPVGRVFAPVEAKNASRRDRVADRHKRLRKKLVGTTERPRLAVFRSNEHIYAQVIDDSVGHTLVAVNTCQKDLKAATNDEGGNKAAAEQIGKKIAELCLSKNISKVCFDRGGFAYHGRVQAVAESARAAGLSF